MTLSNNLKSKNPFSAIILAAGTSDRMGYPKAALKFNDDANFTQHLCNQFLNAGCEKVVVVINNDTAKLFVENNVSFPKNVITVINDNPNFGRFYSLQLGLKNCSNADAVFITNADNPFADSDLLAKMHKELDSADYVYPVFNGKGGHPIVISSKVVAEALQTKFENNILKEFLHKFKSKSIETDCDKILTNINTEREYLELISLI
jgi:molybdenum cofactor cytidylyltransferase